MKHIGKIIFIASCLFFCILPVAGMAVCRGGAGTENRELAEFPQIKEDGKWNIGFLQGLGAYFKDHFAFRPYLVSADAIIQSKVFGVSNVERVVLGENGWLYYAATIDDYLGRNVMSERGVYNAAHNLSLLQQYVQGKGAEFAFTIAPNKNSLYGEHMPYYLQKKEESLSNRMLLEPELEKQGVSYVDLFALFEGQEEVLYLKRDSHWNQKGALLAYHALLEKAGQGHDNYETVKSLRLKETYGDLNRMLYPKGGEPEWDYAYQKEHNFTYQADIISVEDAWIETENKSADGTLLMYRDSFGNSLLPFFADAFSNGYFSRAVPWDIENDMESCKPDVVVCERVEREVSEFAKIPPLMEGPAVTLEREVWRMGQGMSADIEITESENNMDYWKVSGVLEGQGCNKDTQIYIRVLQGEEAKVYEPFFLTTEASDYGYCLYLKKEHLLGKATVEVIVGQDGVLQAVQSLETQR